MHEVLVFGDSLTRGADPGAGRRHDCKDRWPHILQSGLGDIAHIVSDGLGGRTTVYDDAGDIERNGARTLPTLIASHAPLDLIIIMLGSNDLKPTIHGAAKGVAQGVDALVEIVTRSRACKKVLVISPPHFTASPNFGGQPRAGRSISESQKVASLLQAVAERRGAWFFDAANVAVASPIDGVHLDKENTRALGNALVPVVRQILAAQKTPLRIEPR